MLYFAYGSNLHWGQLKGRCPSARFVCVAKLPGYRLSFTRFSPRRQCGVADVVEDRESHVWGAIYEIEECDFTPLDEFEGHVPGRRGNAYERIELKVLREGDEAQPVTAWIYVVADKSEREHVTSAEYKRLVTEGARHWRLPEAYIALLEAIRDSQ